jgi:hypothetical protein
MEAAAARVLSRIWLCNVTTYKNRFLALTPTSRRSSSARSALMEVPNDESARTPLPLTDWENYDRQSPAAPPGIFFSLAFSHLYAQRVSLSLRRAEVLIPTKTRSPQKQIPLYMWAPLPWEKLISSHPAVARQHSLSTHTRLGCPEWFGIFCHVRMRECECPAL